MRNVHPTHDVRITGCGSYLPRVMHTNTTLPALDEPITPGDLERIGVHRRGWASEDETIAAMAAAASRRALARARVTGAEIDVVILANWTQRRYLPEVARDRKSVV